MSLCYVDVETTGLDPTAGQITEVAVERVTRDGPIALAWYVGRDGSEQDVLVRLLREVQGHVWAAYNASFDVGWLVERAARLRMRERVPQARVCVLELARRRLKGLDAYDLSSVATALRLQLQEANRHHAWYDARLCREVHEALGGASARRSIALPGVPLDGRTRALPRRRGLTLW